MDKSVADMTIEEMVEFCNQKVRELKEKVYVSKNQTRESGQHVCSE